MKKATSHHKTVRYVLGGILAIAIIFFLLIWAFTGALGRMVVTALSDGRSVGGFGVVKIERIDGNVLSDFSIEALEIHDESGMWLRVEDTHIRWRPLSLWRANLHIDAINAQSITVLRRPKRTSSAPSGRSGAPIAVNLAGLDVSQLHLAEGVAGPSADFSMQARMSTLKDGVFGIHADIIRLDQQGEGAVIRLDRNAVGDVSGEISVTAPAGGPLATLLQLDDSGWSLDGQIAGALDQGHGEYSLSIDGQRASSGIFEWTEGQWRLNAAMDLNLWRSLPDMVHALAADMSMTAQGAMAPFSITALNARSDALNLQTTDLLQENWRAELSLRPSGTNMLGVDDLSITSARMRFQPGASETGSTYRAELRVEGAAYREFELGQLTSEFEIQHLGDRFTLQTRGDIQTITLPDGRVDQLIGDDINLQIDMDFSQSDNRIALHHAAIRGEGWTAEAEGVWAAGDAELDGRASFVIADVEPLGLDLSGPLSIQAQTRPSPAQWPAITVSLQSQALTGTGQIAALIGALDAEIQVDMDPSHISVPLVRVETNALRFQAQAIQNELGQDWLADGDFILDLSALQPDGLEGQAIGAFELSAGEGGLSVRSQLETGAIRLGDVVVYAPQLRIQADMVEAAITGRWRLDASANDQSVSAQGEFASQSDGGRINLNQAEWGSIQATGSVLLNNNTLSAQFSSGAVESDGRSWASNLTYTGRLDTLFDGMLEGQLNAYDWAFGTGALSQAQIGLGGSLSNLSVSATARGHMLEPYVLSSEGRIEIGPDRTMAQFDLDGTWLDDRRLQTNSPIALSVGPDGLNAEMRLQIGDTHISLDLANTDTQRINLGVSNAPAYLLTELANLPPASGIWNVQADLQRSDGFWRGDGSLNLTDIVSARSPRSDPFNAEAIMSLGERAQISLQASVGGFEATARLGHQQRVTELSRLLGPDWTGAFHLEGPLDALAALYLPRGEQFSGRIEGAGQLEGAHISGQFAVLDGSYRSQTAGLQLSPFSLNARFSENSLQITDAQLGDGAGGLATGNGAITLTEEGLSGDGVVQFEDFSAISRSDLSVQASGDAQLSLRGRRLNVTGEANIARLDLTPVQANGPEIAHIDVEEINRPETLETPYRRPILIELDYGVHADDAVFVSSRTFNSEWSADIQIQGLLNRLNLTGEARLLNGQAALLTRLFEMQEGVITFDGPLEQTQLSFSGRHERAGLSVTARAQGSVAQPQISFESDPNLPEDEILARLLFDQNTAALSPLQAAQLAGQLSGQNWLSALSDAGQQIGIDRLDVRESSTGELSIMGGRRFGENVYVELETGANALGAARIEWSITPDILVLSRLTGDTDAELAIRWRREFD